MNAYGMFTDGMTDEEAHAALEEAQRRRESAGPMELSIEQQAGLEEAVARRNARFVPQFEGDEPARVERVWRLPEDDMFGRAGEYRDTPRTWPRCIARAEFNGYWEDLLLLEDGRWLHRDDAAFGEWITPIHYELESTGGFEGDMGWVPDEALSGVLTHVPIDSHPAREACLQHGIDGTGFGTDPDTGWQGIRQHPLGPDSPELPWRFRIAMVRGRRWRGD
jgi:hypothetical protein